jgi:hypothetical protein
VTPTVEQANDVMNDRIQLRSTVVIRLPGKVGADHPSVVPVVEQSSRQQDLDQQPAPAGRRKHRLESARSVRPQSGSYRSMSQKVGDPLAILDVGLAAGNTLDPLGVGEDQLETILQQVVEGHPVHAGRFHSTCVISPSASQSPSELDGQRRRPERAYFAFDLTARTANEATRDDESLVNIQSRRAGIDHLHGMYS